MEAQGSAEPGEDRSRMTAHSWGAVFAEVAVDEHTHMVEVRRVVATYDIGTLMNNKTGINQLQGGIVVGRRLRAARRNRTSTRLRPHGERKSRRVPRAGERRHRNASM